MEQVVEIHPQHHNKAVATLLQVLLVAFVSLQAQKLQRLQGQLILKQLMMETKCLL